MFIGYYNLANLITLTGMASAIMACMLAIGGNVQVAVMLLMLSGVCDCFDGPVARMDKDRTQAEKVFGVQIDTVSDMVSFGVTPAVILFSMGRNRILPLLSGGPVVVILVSLVLIFYVLCAGIRLAYFNTLEITKTDENAPKIFVGMPVPFSAILFPVLFLLSVTTPVSGKMAAIILVAVYFITAILFISNFKMKKPAGAVYLLYPIYEIVLVVLYVIFGGRLNG